MAVTKHRFDLDRSVAFTILLEVLPGYAESEDNDGGATITRFLDAWYADTEFTDMWAFGHRWAKYE